MAVPEYLANNWLTIAVYLTIIILLVINRKKFDWEGIIALRKTKFGIPFLNRYAKKHQQTVKLLGYCFIGLGFAGMIFIFGYVLFALYQALFVPTAPASFSLVLPGVNIPGSAIFIPLWVLIPLFIVVLIHEAGHGLVARAHGVKVKTTGIVFFGPLAGAFVEPDDKQLEKKDDVVKYSVFAAGPGMNFLTAGIAFALMMLVFNPLTMAMVAPVGFSFDSVQEGFPADISGITPQTTYTLINNQSVLTQEQLTSTVGSLQPNQTLVIANNNSSHTLTTVAHPQDSSQGYLGVIGLATDFDVKETIPKWVYGITNWFSQFLLWIFVLSLGLGLFNLLPLGPVDGGHMSRLAFTRTKGEKKGVAHWKKLSWFLAIIVIFLILWPIVKSVLF
ncbi:MAG: site-2 protease family protein [Candidatus Woesearchaeota archaeon]